MVDTLEAQSRRLRAHLESERGELQEELEREEDCEDDVEDVEEVGVALRLAVELHGETEGVDEDHGEDGVLERRRGHEGPQLVLHRVLRDVAPHRLGGQREFYAVSLEKWKEMYKMQ